MDNRRGYGLWYTRLIPLHHKKCTFTGIPVIEPPNPYIPSNLPEKLIVNFVAPGGVGAVIGETLVNKITEDKISGLKKYISRVSGSLTTTSIWTILQYLGYIQSYIWPHGENPFEGPIVYPFNLFIAITLAPLAPYIADFINSKIRRKK